MRAVFWKEWRELLLGAAVVAALGMLVGLGPKSSSLFAIGVIPLHGCIGVLIGAWQAVRDRRAAADAFLLHRPLASWELHAARSAAGLVAVLGASLASLAVTLYVPWMRGLDTFGPLADEQPFPNWTDYSPGVAAFAVLFAVSTWAASRLGASAGGAICGIMLGAFLSTLLAGAAAATGSNGGAVLLVAACAASAAALLVARQASCLVTGSPR